jgi:hypothetical protein
VAGIIRPQTNKGKRQMSSELTEAKTIIDQLNQIASKLTAGDARFVETWTNYLKSAGNGAQLGRWRMATLRRVAASYGIG